MRYIFMDEAGISANEPVSLVVGLIVHADEHLMAAEALALEALGAVPTELKPGFVFSAKNVFGNTNYQDAWTLTSRLHLLKAMMSIPRRIGIAVTLAAVWRNSSTYGDMPSKLGITVDQYDHLMAFMYCVSSCDRAIRNHAGAREVGSIVAENHEEMRKWLKLTPRALRENPIYFRPEHHRWTKRDEALGYIAQASDYRVTRIRNTIHFVEKADDPLGLKPNRKLELGSFS